MVHCLKMLIPSPVNIIRSRKNYFEKATLKICVFRSVLKRAGVMFNLTGLNYFRHFSSKLPQYFIMSVFIQSFHISTCTNYSY